MITPKVRELRRALQPTTADTFIAGAPHASTDPAVLVRAAATGDDAAWSRLVAKFDSQLRSIGRSFRLAPADIDDAMQATWVRLLARIETVREPAAISGWLATTMRRECLRLLQTNFQEELTQSGDLGDRTDPQDVEGELLAAERHAQFERALDVLPERHRRLMILLADDTTTDYDHISATTGIPRGSIGPIRGRCIARLQRDMELRALLDTAE